MKPAFLLGLAFAICGAHASPPTDVQLRHALDAGMVAHLQALASEYNAAQTEFRVLVSGIPEDGPRGLRRLALPINTARPVLYYNRDAFRVARLDPARTPRTWYDMAPLLGALNESGQRCAYTTAWPAWVMLENSGGIFSKQMMVRWTSMLATWEQAGYFSYSGRGSEAEGRFAAGECAVLTSSSASLPELARRVRFDLGVAPLPYYEDAGVPPPGLPGSAPAVWVEKQSVGVASFFAFLASRAAAARRQREVVELELEAVWRGGKTALDALEAYSLAYTETWPRFEQPAAAAAVAKPVEKIRQAPQKASKHRRLQRQRHARQGSGDRYLRHAYYPRIG